MELRKIIEENESNQSEMEQQPENEAQQIYFEKMKDRMTNAHMKQLSKKEKEKKKIFFDQNNERIVYKSKKRKYFHLYFILLLIFFSFMKYI